jgi:hypothetical protein
VKYFWSAISEMKAGKLTAISATHQSENIHEILIFIKKLLYNCTSERITSFQLLESWYSALTFRQRCNVSAVCEREV